MIDASHLELALALSTTIFVYSEGLVNEIFRVILNTLGNKVNMILKINSFASKLGTEQLFIIILDSFDAASDNISLLNDVLYMATTKVQLRAVNLGIKSIIKLAQDEARIILLLNDSDNLGSNNNASFKG